ncbi:Protein downstream neighbor of Son [Melia azedarach]|uniref:Protein downstream neighbor of Son n=2 Tax=Melia azedarach TaxID=155640 RepID=A0ACC1X2M6_MELAZ|nr:Protein downstream neighbor of Son [Melia azedarach]KAJ4705447.1 Protein downstream neighbor of Son [Melia azedarach]
MAKVAAPTTLPSNSLQMGGGSHKVGLTVKRKTPSELRGEQLKQANVIELVDESVVPLLDSASDNSGVGNGAKKIELSRNPRYIDTRMDEVYPVKKSRFRVLSGKENAKENSSQEQPSSLKNLSVLSTIAAKRREQHSRLGNSVASAEASGDDVVQTHQTIEKCSQATFRSVTELSLGGDRSSGSAAVDMDKALRGLVACKPASDLPSGSSERFGDPSPTYSGNFRSEFHVPGQKAPLDFTLKTFMRVVSSSSVNWIHRSMMCSVYNGLPQFRSHSGCSGDSSSSGIMLASQILSSKALHSWVYPQSSLPSSLISVLTSAATERVEMDFLRQRQLAWEDSFRSLYYMLRKKVCNIFYVCTSYFVVMFVGSDGLGTNRRSCYAYISQSTRGLRSSLKEHDVSFSMPLCRSKVEQETMEDLVELSEMEKHSLGQTRRPSSLFDIDNTPQSLLAFTDNKNVHALYDFILNYRSFLTFLTASDVPILYSPVPFQSAALSAPEVSCREVKRSDHIAALPKGCFPKDGETTQGSSLGSCCSIEIKDKYLPPWIICNLCSLMSSEGIYFEASFMTERTSVGLNVALGTACDKSDNQMTASEDLQPTISAFGIPEAAPTPLLRSGFLKGLEHRNGSYTASLSPV